MTRPVDGFFPQYARGATREDILAAFRESLRDQIDPETGQLFDERVIALVTAPGSRFWTEADAIDLVGMGIQQRAITMLNNLRPVGSSSSWLKEYHGGLIGEGHLPATGAVGQVQAEANAGVSWQGSTTAGDPAAIRGTDSAGKRYQVLITGTTPGNGKVTLWLKALDPGFDTNLPLHTDEEPSIITWSNPPVGGQPTAKVVLGFVGGTDKETDEDFSQRLEDEHRHKQGAGNNAQIRALAREVSNAIDDAFVYACALYAGSFIVSVTAKRTSSGPLATLPIADQLLAVQDRVVPPGSPEVPERAYALVLAPVSVPTDMVLKLSQRKGSSDGWADAVPWPLAGSAPAYISALTDQENFTISTDGGDLPTLGTPSLMAWDDATSRFHVLSVQSIVDAGGGTYTVVLNGAPGFTLATNVFISPAMSVTRADLLAEAIEGYFDGLGPGQLVADTDVRYQRAARFPEPPEKPYAIGQDVVLDVQDALPLTGAVLVSPDPGNPAVSEPPVPVHPTLGPGKLTLFRLAVYPLS